MPCGDLARSRGQGDRTHCSAAQRAAGSGQFRDAWGRFRETAGTPEQLGWSHRTFATTFSVHLDDKSWTDPK